MQKLLTFLTLLLFLMSSAGTLEAQDTITCEIWLDKMVNIVYAEANLTAEDKRWVKKVISANCDCNAIEDEEKGQECVNELLKQENLPVEEADFAAMTPEQTRKFYLLAPLISSSPKKCPE